jgi:hypothetical protein
MPRRARRPPRSSAPLWTCPACGRPFASTRQSHACETSHIRSIEDHFSRSLPRVRVLFDRFVRIAEACGPVHLVSSKTRIGLQVRMTFAALMPQRSALRGHLVLARRVEDPRFVSIQTISPRNHVHVFRLLEPGDLDAHFRRLVAESYKVGCQEHLRSASSRVKPRSALDTPSGGKAHARRSPT